jgi:hypothetical protein
MARKPSIFSDAGPGPVNIRGNTVIHHIHVFTYRDSSHRRECGRGNGRRPSSKPARGQPALEVDERVGQHHRGQHEATAAADDLGCGRIVASDIRYTEYVSESGMKRMCGSVALSLQR